MVIGENTSCSASGCAPTPADSSAIVPAPHGRALEAGRPTLVLSTTPIQTPNLLPIPSLIWQYIPSQCDLQKEFCHYFFAKELQNNLLQCILAMALGNKSSSKALAHCRQGYAATAII